MDASRRQEYWRRNLRLMSMLLVVWALVSFGAGIIFVEPLNKVDLMGVPLGFWFAQQGAIVIFVILIFVYVKWMDRLDRKYGVEEIEQEVTHG